MAANSSHARHPHCRWTATTLSKRALQAVSEAVNSDSASAARTSLRFGDWRDLQLPRAQRFSSLICADPATVLTIPAVHLAAFYATAAALLAPGGTLAVLTITAERPPLHEHHPQASFLQEHLLPGAHLPTLAEVGAAAAAAGLQEGECEAREWSGDFAATLRERRARLVVKWPQGCEVPDAELRKCGAPPCVDLALACTPAVCLARACRTMPVLQGHKAEGNLESGVLCCRYEIAMALAEAAFEARLIKCTLVCWKHGDKVAEASTSSAAAVADVDAARELRQFRLAKPVDASLVSWAQCILLMLFGMLLNRLVSGSWSVSTASA